MYSKFIVIFITFLLFSNFSKTIGEEESEEGEDETTTAKGKGKGSKQSTTESSSEEEGSESTSKGSDGQNQSTTESDKESDNKKDSKCGKKCEKNSNQMSQNQCVPIKFKKTEKAKSKDECMEKCKKDTTCASATYIKPRNPTTFDLRTLYDKVIESENWVLLPKKQGKNSPEAEPDMGADSSPSDDMEDPNEPDDDLDDSEQSYGLVNTSALKMASEVIGSCFVYEEKLPIDLRLECTPSHLSFDYDEIECIEDPNCDKPRKKCPRGRCGPTCKDFNYIHIPNACIGKYYFGHLSTDSLESCLEFCLSAPECKSVDLGSMGSCLINYVNRNDTQLIMGCDSKNNEVWDYYEILQDSECSFEKPSPAPEEDTCANKPLICQNGGNCESIQLPPPQQSFTYECQCPCNWCGKHCDQLNMKTFKNGCLNSSVLVWSVAESSADCIDMCLDEIHCKGVSYSATSGTCALHWGDHETDPILPSPQCPSYRTDIAEREWTFYEIICDTSTCHSSVEVMEVKEVKGCASSPCMNGGECADIFQSGEVIGFHCLCKCGYCGDRCEKQNYVLTDDACIWGSQLSSDSYRKGVPLSTCLNVCASKYPMCRSVDYSSKGECLLNKRDSDIAFVTKKCNNYMRQRWGLYDLSCVCNNNPVLY